MEVALKKCNKCELEQHVSEFRLETRHTCRTCIRKYQKEYREANSQLTKWAKNNRDYAITMNYRDEL